jgi:hypothetical protein
LVAPPSRSSAAAIFRTGVVVTMKNGPAPLVQFCDAMHGSGQEAMAVFTNVTPGQVKSIVITRLFAGPSDQIGN